MLNQIGLASQLSIADILDRLGIPHRQNRCACPVHGGDNPTAFSFSDQVYYCHTRGCSGNTITLLKHLLNTNFKGVVEYLGGDYRFGETALHTNSRERSHKIIRSRRRVPIELFRLKSRFFEVQQISALLTAHLKLLHRWLKRAVVDLNCYYAWQQKLDWQLYELDVELARLQFEIKRFKEVI